MAARVWWWQQGTNLWPLECGAALPKPAAPSAAAEVTQSLHVRAERCLDGAFVLFSNKLCSLGNLWQRQKVPPELQLSQQVASAGVPGGRGGSSGLILAVGLSALGAGAYVSSGGLPGETLPPSSAVEHLLFSARFTLLTLLSVAVSSFRNLPGSQLCCRRLTDCHNCGLKP